MKLEKERIEEKMKKAVELVKTKVEWPVLPPLKDTEESELNQSTESFSQSMNSKYSADKKKRKQIKPSLSTSISSSDIKILPSTSLNGFNKASWDTKKFIMDIEKLENEIYS